MQAFDLGELRAQRQQAGRAYLEFLRVSSLSAGVYHLKAREPDLQRPHGEDEVYFVVAGRGQFRAGSEVSPAQPGAVLFVEKGVEHRFFDITEDLTLLVFFAPAEGTLTA
jgi:mannose-6-phosphate isomerase-like protein (cupin superfamily)